MTITRRRLIVGGGGALALSAVMPSVDAIIAAVDAAPRPRDHADVVYLRTASSIEHVGLRAYRLAIESGLVETVTIRTLLRLFRTHHQAHAAQLEATTFELHGRSYRKPNRAVLEQLKPAINALSDEASALKLAASFEVIAAQTYQAMVGRARHPRLGLAAMSIGASESRHLAALLALAGEDAVPFATQPTEHAVAPGIGL